MSLHHLPTEPLADIIANVAQDDLTTLCLISKACNTVFIPFLYYTMHLPTFTQAIIGCKAILSNHVAAQAARNFHM